LQRLAGGGADPAEVDSQRAWRHRAARESK